MFAYPPGSDGLGWSTDEVQVEQWTRLTNEAETQIQNILNDLPGAVRFMEQSQQNREQVYKYKTPGEKANAAPSPFSQVRCLCPRPP
jgi:hypothetical protein